MLHSLTTYPYFWASLLGIAILVGIAAPFRTTFRIALFSGGLAAPTGIFAPTMTAYWDPVRIAGGSIGVEDFMFGFGSGFNLWLLVAPLPMLRGVQPLWDWPRVVQRLVPVVAIGPLVYVPLWALGVHPMTALYAGFALAGGYVIARAPHLWMLGLPGLILYPLTYVLVLQATFWLWPELKGIWEAGHLLSEGTVFAMPYGELLWAVAAGAFWPPVVAYALALMPRDAAKGALG